MESNDELDNIHNLTGWMDNLKAKIHVTNVDKDQRKHLLLTLMLKKVDRKLRYERKVSRRARQRNLLSRTNDVATSSAMPEFFPGEDGLFDLLIDGSVAQWESAETTTLSEGEQQVPNYYEDEDLFESFFDVQVSSEAATLPSMGEDQQLQNPSEDNEYWDEFFIQLNEDVNALARGDGYQLDSIPEDDNSGMDCLTSLISGVATAEVGEQEGQSTPPMEDALLEFNISIDFSSIITQEE